MKTASLALAAFGLCICTLFSTAVLFSTDARAQEGHPMSGSWVGDWGPNSTERNRVVIIMEWTGSELVGTINPGQHAIPLKTAMVDPANWSLHAEAQGLDAAGKSVNYTIDGTLDDLGTYNRSIAGTWKVGNQENSFSITRQ